MAGPNKSYEYSKQKEKQQDKVFADMANGLPPEARPDSNVQAAGHVLYEFLKGIADGPVDRGAGLKQYDLWFEYGGTKIYMVLKESK